MNNIIESPSPFKGKTILVTGASSGIGRGSAISLSHAGANLVICGRDIERLEETYSLMVEGKHQKFIGDLTQPEVIYRLIHSLETLDGVVFSAGQMKTIPFLYSEENSFKELFEINFFSPTEILRQLVKEKILKNGSSVVFISSIAGEDKFAIGNTIYGTSKSAVNTVVRYCAIELGGQNIRVNAICPGSIINTKIFDQYSKQVKDIVIDKYEKSCPLKRIGEVEDVVNLELFLLSEGSSWITGQTINVDGGASLL